MTVTEWDPYAPEALADRPASWAELRERCPVARTDRMGGFWTVSRYEEVVAIARDARRFNNSGGPQIGELEPAVRGFVAEMLEPALAAGAADLAGVRSYPLPARTLCLWLGLPDTEWSYLKGVAEKLFNAEEGRGNDPATRAACNDELYAYARRLVAERVERPFDPCVDLIGVDLISGMPRWANEEVEVHGRAIPAGEMVMLLWASANRDPQQFPEPDRCLLDRTPNDHTTFGYGIHRCIGADLARLELRVAIEEVLGRTAWVELAGEPVRTTFIRLGVSYLPVRFAL